MPAKTKYELKHNDIVISEHFDRDEAAEAYSQYVNKLLCGKTVIVIYVGFSNWFTYRENDDSDVQVISVRFGGMVVE